jgi:hypothetical protein
VLVIYFTGTNLFFNLINFVLEEIRKKTKGFKSFSD